MNLIKTSQKEIAVSKAVDKLFINNMTEVTLPIEMFLLMYKLLPTIDFKEHQASFADSLLSVSNIEDWYNMINDEAKRIEFDRECATIASAHKEYKSNEI
jgi:hypothetical protein